MKTSQSAFQLIRCAGLVSLALLSVSCTESIAPVDATRPSEDARIINSSGQMSDGGAIPVHRTETFATDIEMVSTGFIGGISIDRAGNIYNTNFHENVWRTSPDGKTVLLNGEFTSASGNLVLANGDLLQGDWTDNKIFRIKPDGTRSVFSETGLNGPVGMVQRPDGTILVANHRGKFIAGVPQNGGAATELLRDERMQAPNGLTMDDGGNVYIADLKIGYVFKWTPDGTLSILAELPGKGNSHNVFAVGALYVNKIWDHVIYRVELDTGAYGIVTGNGTAGYLDGPTGVATIEEPNGIATTPEKDVIFFNTHRGAMSRGSPGLVIVRKLLLDQ